MSTATVTAVIGPGNTLTSKVFQNVNRFWFDLEIATLTIDHEPLHRIVVLDIAASTTYTLTKSGTNYTLTVS